MAYLTETNQRALVQIPPTNNDVKRPYRRKTRIKGTGANTESGPKEQRATAMTARNTNFPRDAR